MLMSKCLLAMPILMLVILELMLILMLLNLNTGYADTDADLCIRIMSLCWTHKKGNGHLDTFNVHFIFAQISIILQLG